LVLEDCGWESLRAKVLEEDF
jgi:hypothetical protein